MNVFENGAEELERLRLRIKETFQSRHQGERKKALWEKATRDFHESYDRLAFPGGLNREFERLRMGEPEAIEMAVRFLEVNPRFFRSGYHKEAILSLLRKLPLTEDQSERLRSLILSRIRERPTRELRHFARLAPKVWSANFEATLKSIAENSNRTSARHAKLALNALASSRGTKSNLV